MSEPISIPQWIEATPPSYPTMSGAFIIQWIEITRACRYEKKLLWEAFRADFKGWDFGETEPHIRTELRNYLRENGVYILAARGTSIAAALAGVLEEDTPHPWTPAEKKEQQQIEEKQRAKKERAEQRRKAYIETLQGPITRIERRYVTPIFREVVREYRMD